MFRIPSLIFAVSFVLPVVQSFWFPWFLWFFISSLMTATLLGLKLLLQAPVSRQTYPDRPPPLPDPCPTKHITGIWALTFLSFIAPHLSTLWQNICLVILLPFFLPLFLAPWQFLPPVLDKFSNTVARPPWFVKAPRRQTTRRLAELHH